MEFQFSLKIDFKVSASFDERVLGIHEREQRSINVTLNIKYYTLALHYSHAETDGSSRILGIFEI